jgi:hypothetical protein
MHLFTGAPITSSQSVGSAKRRNFSASSRKFMHRGAMLLWIARTTCIRSGESMVHSLYLVDAGAAIEAVDHATFGRKLRHIAAMKRAYSHRAICLGEQKLPLHTKTNKAKVVTMEAANT